MIMDVVTTDPAKNQPNRDNNIIKAWFSDTEPLRSDLPGFERLHYVGHQVQHRVRRVGILRHEKHYDERCRRSTEPHRAENQIQNPKHRHGCRVCRPARRQAAGMNLARRLIWIGLHVRTPHLSGTLDYSFRDRSLSKTPNNSARISFSIGTDFLVRRSRRIK